MTNRERIMRTRNRQPRQWDDEATQKYHREMQELLEERARLRREKLQATIRKQREGK